MWLDTYYIPFIHMILSYLNYSPKGFSIDVQLAVNPRSHYSPEAFFKSRDDPLYGL